MGKYILVDTENVNLKSLCGIEELNSYDKVILFLSSKSKAHYTNKRIDAIKTNATIQKINVMTGIKNSLDFQLVSMLGLLIGDHRHLNIHNEYYIISNDQGFLSSINLLNGYTEKVNIELVSDISELLKINNTDINKENLYSEIKPMFRLKTLNKIITALKGCNNLVDAKTSLLKTFNYNPLVYNQIEFILRKYYKDINKSIA